MLKYMEVLALPIALFAEHTYVPSSSKVTLLISSFKELGVDEMRNLCPDAPSPREEPDATSSSALRRASSDSGLLSTAQMMMATFPSCVSTKDFTQRFLGGSRKKEDLI